MSKIDALRGIFDIFLFDKTESLPRSFDDKIKKIPNLFLKRVVNLDEIKKSDAPAVYILCFDNISPSEEIIEALNSIHLKNENPSILLVVPQSTIKIREGLSDGGVIQIYNPQTASEDIIINLSVILQNLELKKLETENHKSRDQILHMLSHELINPISSGQSLYEMIKADPKNLENFSEFVEDSFKLALDLIDISRKFLSFEENRDEASFDYYKVEDIVGEALKSLKHDPMVEKKKVEFNKEIDSNYKILVSWAQMINFVMIPLLHNAVKFSNANSVINIISSMTDDGIVSLTVKDSGIGIPEKMLTEIIDVSKATKRKGTDGEEGLGYSAALAYKIIRLFGGDMEFKSEGKDQGCSVTLYFKGQRGA